MLDDPVRLSAVAAATSAAASPHAGLHRLTRLAARVTGTRFAFLSLVTGDLEVLTAAAGRAAASLPGQLSTSQSVCQHLVREGRQLLVPDLRADPRYAGLVEVRDLGMRSYAGAPVHAGDGTVLGGLCVADDVPRDWSADDAALLEDLAAAASGELAALVVLQELAHTREEERRRTAEQAALHRVAAAVVRGEQPQRVLQQAADELVRLHDATAALVLRFRPDGGTSVVVTAGRLVGAPTGWSWYGRLLEQVRRTGTGAALLDDDDQPCAAVPIEVGGRTWGALVLVLGPEGSSGRVQQLAQLADFVSLVLVNAEAQLQLTRLARTDPLTGAPNRRVLEERYAEELARCGRTGGQVLVALMDVDLFKDVNDAQGHDVGDAVLVALAERVGEVLREGDVLARLGGDEWGLLLPAAAGDPHGALERLRAAVAAEPLAGVPVTVTLGGVLVGAGEPWAEAARRADVALYSAKRSGRDRVGLAAPRVR